MKRLTIALITLLLASGMPIQALAASHGEHNAQGHDMASMDEGFVEIGKDTREGVVATFKIKPYDEKARAAMAKMGMNTTHHVMVSFADAKSGAAIASGQVAVKIKGQDSKPVMMMQMGQDFGANIALPDPGRYTIEFGTKLADGNKRQFEVGFHNQ
jgi:VCBS repeat-containing protein